MPSSKRFCKSSAFFDNFSTVKKIELGPLHIFQFHFDPEAVELRNTKEAKLKLLHAKPVSFIL